MNGRDVFEGSGPVCVQSPSDTSPIRPLNSCKALRISLLLHGTALLLLAEVTGRSWGRTYESLKF